MIVYCTTTNVRDEQQKGRSHDGLKTSGCKILDRKDAVSSDARPFCLLHHALEPAFAGKFPLPLWGIAWWTLSTGMHEAYEPGELLSSGMSDVGEK